MISALFIFGLSLIGALLGLMCLLDNKAKPLSVIGYGIGVCICGAFLGASFAEIILYFKHS